MKRAAGDLGRRTHARTDRARPTQQHARTDRPSTPTRQHARPTQQHARTDRPSTPTRQHARTNGRRSSTHWRRRRHVAAA
ncbi:hypothetical protein AAC387_Pa12g0255 [Persea americana]